MWDSGFRMGPTDESVGVLFQNATVENEPFPEQSSGPG